MNFVAISSVFQIINALLVIAWGVLTINALVKLSSRKLPATPKAIWTLIILVIPILGAIAFFIVKPEDNQE